ncbi:uncharacterized protein METZ01_LOCUS470923, partial [marine metagenome]
ISDYVLDIKSENSKEFKTDQIPENSPNILKMAEQKTDNTQNINEEPETVVDDADDDADDDVIDNSPDKELVIKAVNDITGLYLEYTMYKTKKDDRYKEVFNEIISKTSNFKFTALFKAKLINRIEKITALISKYEREIIKICIKSLSIPKKVLLQELKNNKEGFEFAKPYIKNSKLTETEKQGIENQLKKFQKKLKAIEDNQDISISEIKKINKDRRSGELKERNAKKEMVEANLRLVISIAKKYT